MGDETKTNGVSIVKDYGPKAFFLMLAILGTAAFTSRHNEEAIHRIEERGTLQAQKNTERITVLEAVIVAQTEMIKEMRTDIKVLLGRGKE